MKLRMTIDLPSAAIGAAVALLATNGQFFSYGAIAPLPYIAGAIGIGLLGWVGLRRPSATPETTRTTGIPNMPIENGIDGWLNGLSPSSGIDDYFKALTVTRYLQLQLEHRLPNQVWQSILFCINHMRLSEPGQKYDAFEAIARIHAESEKPSEVDLVQFMDDYFKMHPRSFACRIASPGFGVVPLLHKIKRARRELGPIPPSLLTWVQHHSLQTWQAIDDLDRPTCHVSSAGIMAHLLAEDRAGSPLHLHDVSIAVAAIRKHATASAPR